MSRTISRFLSAALIFSLIVLPFSSVITPARTAYAADEPYVTFDTFSGPPGVTLAVSGGSWGAEEIIHIYRNAPSGTPLATVTTDSLGMFETEIGVPANAPQGPFTVVAVNPNNDQASNSYYVVPFSPFLTIEAESHSPFAHVSVSGINFAPNEHVLVSLGGNSVMATANNAGSFNDADLIVPQVQPGLYTITATGQASGASTQTFFYIDAFYTSISPSSYFLIPGETLSFSGTGFAPGETVNVRQGASFVSSILVGSDGSFTNAGGFVIPVSYQGTSKTFVLRGSQSNASESVTVTIGTLSAMVEPSIYFGAPGATVTFTGRGFLGGELVKVYANTNPTPVAQFTVSASGTFTNAGTTTLPFSAQGTSITYRVVGNDSGVEASTEVTVGTFSPTLEPSNYFANPGTDITVVGSGFAPHEQISFTGGTIPNGAITTNATGTFSTLVHLPYLGGQMLVLTATGGSSHVTASVALQLGNFYPTVEPSSYYVFPGDNITLNGADFAQNEQVVVMLNDAAFDVFSTDSDGTFSEEVLIPFTASGALDFTFRGVVSHATVATSITVGELNPYLESSAYYAEPGTIISVQGIRFASNENVSVTVGDASSTTIVAANALGNTPEVSVDIPYMNGGSVPITFTGISSNVSASVSIVVGNLYPSVVADLYYVSPGATVTFSGTGFAPGETVAVVENDNALSSITAGVDGTFTAPLVMPFGVQSATYTFTGAITHTTIPLTITLAEFHPAIWFDNYYAQAGSALTILGAGFAGGETVTFRTANGQFGTTTADASGSFEYATAVPFAPAGSLDIIARGAQSQVETTASLTVAPIYTNIQLGSYAGPAGSTIEFIGSGYLPHNPIEILTDRTGSEVVASFTADASGSFDNTDYSIPGDFSEGELVLTIRSLHSFDTKTITFYVTSPLPLRGPDEPTPPPAPAPSDTSSGSDTTTKTSSNPEAKNETNKKSRSSSKSNKTTEIESKVTDITPDAAVEAGPSVDL